MLNVFLLRGPRGSMSYVVGSNNSYKHITNKAWVCARLCKLQKRCTRLAAASDKVYQLLAHGRWFSPGTPASSTTKTGRHEIAEILLKVALKHQRSNQINLSITLFIGYTFLIKKIISLRGVGIPSFIFVSLLIVALQRV